MKIKDAEKITGVPSANIRYYEQEGLIHPQRNQENNYREYTSSDIECLQKIKFLRLLGVSLPDIRLLTTGKLSLDTVMKHRLEQIDTEEMNLSEMRTVCEYILRNHLDLSMINEELFEASGISWQARLEDIFRSDPVKDFLSKKELNRTVGCMLAWGFFVNLLVTLLCGNYLLHHTDSRICFYITAICVMMSAINSILIHWSSDTRFLVVVFHLCSILLTPLFLGVYGMIYDLVRGYVQLEAIHLASFWLLMLFFILILTFISQIYTKLFTKISVAFLFCSLYAAFMTLFFFFLTGHWLVPFVFSFLFTCYFGLGWTSANLEKSSYNRYYAVITATSLIDMKFFSHYLNTGSSHHTRT